MAKQKQVKIVHNNYEWLNGRLIVINVGSDEHPATEEDLQEVQDRVADVFKDVQNVSILVTHNAFDVEVF